MESAMFIFLDDLDNAEVLMDSGNGRRERGIFLHESQ